MYCGEKPRKAHRNTPSFSSTLLDEIYRSIDGGGEQPPRDLRGRRGRQAANGIGGDELARTCLVERWMQNRVPRTPFAERCGTVSHSDTVPRSSLPKPIRTGHRRNPTVANEEEVMKGSKWTASKIYANLKKMRQPVSPGARLTSFINSLFTKKSRTRDPTDRINDDSKKKSSVYGDGGGRPPLPPQNYVMKACQVHHQDDDAGSDSSSDLFELDHLALFGGGFTQQLPLYQTTCLHNTQPVL